MKSDLLHLTEQEGLFTKYLELANDRKIQTTKQCWLRPAAHNSTARKVIRLAQTLLEDEVDEIDASNEAFDIDKE